VAIGRDGANSVMYFHGGIDEVALYDHVLGGARIKAHYQAAPGASVSRYVSTLDETAMRNYGCLVAGDMAANRIPHDATVLLGFGDPRAFTGGMYGASVYSAPDATTNDILRGTTDYALGFTQCARDHALDDYVLTVALGTTNHGSDVSFSHGAAWAGLVNQAN